MKLLLILGLACAVAQALPSNDQDDWAAFKAKHSKVYSSPSEEGYRMRVFLENKRRIAEHNQKYEQGQISFSVAVNHLADMSSEEIKQRFNGFKPEMKVPGVPYAYNGAELPTTVDWRTKGAVTPVKDQGQCGSCWAFSTTGSLEGQHFLKTKKLVSLSEQNLVDCSGNYGNAGCNGGLMDQAFKYIKANGGIDTEQSYPYTGVEGPCRFKKANVGATVTGYVDIPSGNEDALQKASGTIGPISVAIDASNWSFQMYSSGVYVEPQCSTTQLDHGVLVVGYGTENGQDYWLVKNSWNAGWGEQGYIKMARNLNNQCGIATMASYPTV